MRQIDLTGKTAIITGSSQGIGLVTAQTLHAAGANVVINYFEEGEGKNKALADAVVADLGERAMSAAADVRKPEELEAMVAATTEKFGSLDILVNNAGILRDKSFKKMSHQEWHDVIDTNLTGVFNCCKSVLGSIAENGACLLYTSPSPRDRTRSRMPSSA